MNKLAIGHSVVSEQKDQKDRDVEMRLSLTNAACDISFFRLFNKRVRVYYG